MLAVLLSFGAVNSLIPLLIIIMLIAAAAGLTRGYNLFAIFGIGTLVGAASAAKKGSVVGRNPYRPVAAKQSSLFMPKPKSRKTLKAEREERKENKETAKRVVKDIDQQLKSKTPPSISTILKTGNYFENPKQGTYVNLKGTAANVPVPAIKTPYKGYRNKLKHNEEIREAARAQAKNLVMAERATYLDSIATARAAEIEQLIKSGKWGAMSEKQKIALVEKGFVRPVKGQRSKVAMAGALLRGNIKGLKEEFNKAPSNSKALIGIVGALATGAGVGGARRAIINELKKMPNYGAQTQQGSSGGPIGFQYQGPIGFQYQGKRGGRLVHFIKSPIFIESTSFVFLGPIGWLGVKGMEKGINKLRQMKQKGKGQQKAAP